MAQVNLPAGFELVDDGKPSINLPPGFVLADNSVSDQPTHTAGMDLTPPAVMVGGARVALPILQRGIEEVATSPTLSKNAKILGKGIGAISGIVKAGPLGADARARIGGRVAESTTRIAQRIAGPLATIGEKVAPYGQALSTLSGAQGLLDLAQIAEPNRKDIGVLGISIGQPRSDAEKAESPALINMLLRKLLGESR